MVQEVIDYSFDGQHEGEDVLFLFRRHPVVMRKQLLYFLFIALIGALPMAFWPLESWIWKPFFGGIFVGGLVFFYGWIGWFYSIYIVTSERIIQIKQKGFFSRQVIEIGHDKVQNINYEVEGIQQSLLKFGTIVIQTYAGDLMLTNIHHPGAVHGRLVKVVRDKSTPGPSLIIQNDAKESNEK